MVLSLVSEKIELKRNNVKRKIGFSLITMFLKSS